MTRSGFLRAIQELYGRSDSSSATGDASAAVGASVHWWWFECSAAVALQAFSPQRAFRAMKRFDGEMPTGGSGAACDGAKDWCAPSPRPSPTARLLLKIQVHRGRGRRNARPTIQRMRPYGSIAFQIEAPGLRRGDRVEPAATDRWHALGAPPQRATFANTVPQCANSGCDQPRQQGYSSLDP